MSAVNLLTLQLHNSSHAASLLTGVFCFVLFPRHYDIACFQVTRLFGALRVKFDLKDVFIHPDFMEELQERVGDLDVTVPQVFINGDHIGVSVLTAIPVSRKRDPAENLIIIFKNVHR